jgi:guanylate kinase
MKAIKRRGKLFVISAPSGSGKTTLCKKLILSLSGRRKLLRSVSVTTRRPRKGERPGRDYFFISERQFRERKSRQGFLEWARVLGCYYGTPREFVERETKRGNDVLLSIDVQGAKQIRRSHPEAVFIFILPPSFAELERRLLLRSTEERKEISRRLKLAEKELGFIKYYNYVLLNDNIQKALTRLKMIVRKERKKK